MTPAYRRTALRCAAWGGALAALAGAFALYLRADFMVLLANQLWTCF